MNGAGYVAIIGKPNAGKSTLLNAILQQKLSIVTSKAQTTRHRIIAAHSEDDFQCIFLDTPGVLRPVLRPVRCCPLALSLLQVHQPRVHAKCWTFQLQCNIYLLAR